MRLVLSLAIPLFLVPSVTVRAANPPEGPPEFWEIYQPGPDGLPKIPISGQYFGYDDTTKKFVPIFKPAFNQVFTIWWKGWGDYGWVTAQDTRKMLKGSKVQGYRIGFSDTRALDWYELGHGDKPNTWTRVLDRSKPTIYRLDPTTGEKVVSETAPAEWTTWGGSLDPAPGGEASCTVTATPTEVKVGEKVRFDVETKGDATALSMFGQEMLLPRDFVEKTFDRAGVYDVSATVGKGQTRNACRATVRVAGTFGTDDAFGCSLTVEPQRIAPRQVALVTLKTFGDVTRVEYLNQAVAAPGRGALYRSVMNDKPGNYYVHAKVVSNGVEKTCRMPFTVTANASGR